MQQYLKLLKEAPVEVPPEGDDVEPKPLEEGEVNVSTEATAQPEGEGPPNEVNVSTEATAQPEGEGPPNEVNGENVTEPAPIGASELAEPEVTSAEPSTIVSEPTPEDNEIPQETPET